MKLNVSRWALMAGLAIAALIAGSGCSSQKAPETSPATIKADMGGNYTPNEAAAGRAFQQQETAKAAQIQQQNSAAAQQGKQ